MAITTAQTTLQRGSGRRKKAVIITAPATPNTALLVPDQQSKHAAAVIRSILILDLGVTSASRQTKPSNNVRMTPISIPKILTLRYPGSDDAQITAP
jgi:hypothetical protein